MVFNIKKFNFQPPVDDQYKRQLSRLRGKGIKTGSIENTVMRAIKNINHHKAGSFVIYGEPQSGKTEMMICLTAKLLDEGIEIVIILLKDNVQLLNQNLERFRRSQIAPTPRNYVEIMDPAISIKVGSKWIIFAKKNTHDLKKLTDVLGKYQSKVIVDDEGDYATPNSKVNKNEQTQINKFVETLIGKNGVYIGVTATPARLDLNNTFGTQNNQWIAAESPPEYTGQDVFFPITPQKDKYRLNLLPDRGDNPRYLREAIFKFLVNVAYLNKIINSDYEENYCMLVHTSGIKADHRKDYTNIIKTINSINDHDSTNGESYIEAMWNDARNLYPGKEDILVQYIISNIARSSVIILNSDWTHGDTRHATVPSTPFTITIGGDIVSRGVTFENLLSMFFTRDTKHKIQQDTYIQRARMFGYREQYLKYFELTIPRQLFVDWHKCFVFHRLSLDAVKNNKSSPVWLEDASVRAVAHSSIDKTTVNMNRGEMGFEVFEYPYELDAIVRNKGIPPIQVLRDIADILEDNHIPEYLINFIERFNLKPSDVVIHNTRSVQKDADYHDSLEREKGIFGGDDIRKFPSAVHHIMIVKNTDNKARVVYRHVGSITMIQKFKEV